MPTTTKRLILGTLIATGVTASAVAGLDDGLSAYDRGDYAAAYRELAPAAAGGAPSAQYALARMYLSGEGVARDSAQGLKWLREAATAGVGLAQYQLGVCYELGYRRRRRITAKRRGGIAWPPIAVCPRRNIASASLYFNGLGVARDLIAAHMWLNLAAARLPPGDPA